VLDEVTEERERTSKLRVVDVAIQGLGSASVMHYQGLVQAVDKFCHAATLHSTNLSTAADDEHAVLLQSLAGISPDMM
jgi:hypothetical protein